MKYSFLMMSIFLFFTGCEIPPAKYMQTIEFNEIASQRLGDGFLALQAKSSSGLPVSFFSSDPEVVRIDKDTAFFLQSGWVTITASQCGNEQYYEAPHLTQRLVIRDWDPNKLAQSIEFELPEEWTISQLGTAVPLNATATSGLSVKYTSDNSLGEITYSAKYLYLYHGTYEAYIRITAYQDGDDLYNPAENVVRTIHVIGDVTH